MLCVDELYRFDYNRCILETDEVKGKHLELKTSHTLKFLVLKLHPNSWVFDRQADTQTCTYTYMYNFIHILYKATRLRDENGPVLTKNIMKESPGSYKGLLASLPTTRALRIYASQPY